MLESQAKFNEILGRHFEDTNRTGRKKQGPLYAVERWRDIKIVLKNKLTKTKSKLRTNLATEISKPIRSHKQFVHAREAIESTISMIEMAFWPVFSSGGLNDSKQLCHSATGRRGGLGTPFANEQERLAMTRVLPDYKTAYETNGRIDLKKLFNQLGSIIKPEVESPVDDSLQAAMMAHARMQPKPIHQDKGNYTGPKKKQDTRQGNHESPRMEKLMQFMYDMKAETGALRRALQIAGICVEAPRTRSITSTEARSRSLLEWKKTIASRSLVPGKIPQDPSDSDSEDESHEISNMAVEMKRRVPINPRALSAALHGMTRSDHVRARTMAEEHADRESGAEDFEARESFSGGGSDDELQEYRPTFDHFSTRDAMAEEVEHDIDSPTVADDDVMLNKENEIDDDQESEEIADETVNEPTSQRRTRSQGKKTFIIPDAASPSDSEDEPTPSKRRISRIKARSKYLRSIQDHFPQAPSPRPRKAKKPAAKRGRGSA
jgi:hypothetical protein